MSEDNHSPESQEDDSSRKEIRLSASQMSASYSGPLPLPSTLDKYNQVLPGAADRIMAMAEKEQNHRHKMDDKIIDAQIEEMRLAKSQNRFGQICGLIIGITAIVTGGSVCIAVSPLYGAAIATTGVASLVSVFVLGKRINSATDDEPPILPPEEDEDLFLSDQ